MTLASSPQRAWSPSRNTIWVEPFGSRSFPATWLSLPCGGCSRAAVINPVGRPHSHRRTSAISRVIHRPNVVPLCERASERVPKAPWPCLGLVAVRCVQRPDPKNLSRAAHHRGKRRSGSKHLARARRRAVAWTPYSTDVSSTTRQGRTDADDTTLFLARGPRRATWHECRYRGPRRRARRSRDTGARGALPRSHGQQW